MNIAFTINQLGMEGLGATLNSMLHHCSDSAQLKLYFLCNKLGKKHKENIQNLLHLKNFDGTFQFIDFNAEKEFGHLQSLHGDWTAYGKLLIPELIEAEKILSLDTDLLILLDILELKNFYQEDYAVTAFNTGEAQITRDAIFYCKHLELPLQTPIFNTGVILFNSLIWKAQKITSLYQKIGKKYATHLLCADQTLLNATLCGEFERLPPKYNFRWFPTDMVNDNQQAVIFHFVGSPKPWDILGQRIHPGYDTWHYYNPSFWIEKYSNITYQKVYRTWKIKKSIARCLINQFKSGINASANYYPSNL